MLQKRPRPSFPGMQTLRNALAAKYAAAASRKESDIADASFDELEHNGFIDRLYAGGHRWDGHACSKGISIRQFTPSVTNARSTLPPSS
jgi:hypothetical protein